VVLAYRTELRFYFSIEREGEAVLERRAIRRDNASGVFERGTGAQISAKNLK
jgi:hypothetical protein